MRILIVDDHEVVRRGVLSLLSAEPGFEVCGEAVDGLDAIDKAQLLKPEVVVMDISMPNLNGLDASREIRRILPQTKILILSQHHLQEMIRQAFAAGANGYVVKTAVSTELVAAVKTLQHDGDIPAPAAFISSDVDLDVQEVLQRSIVFERALRETSERLRLAQQVARIGTFEFNVQTGVNRWTPELEALHGLSPGTFPRTFSAWERMVHPDDRLATLRSLAAAANGSGFENEWRIVWPDGSVHWMLGRAFLFRDESGAPERWIGVNIDITERKMAAERAERLSRLLDISFDAIVLRDAGDCVRFWNRGAQDLYGWTAEEAYGNVTHTLLSTRFPVPLELIAVALRKDGRWEGELTHRAKDGHVVTVVSRWALVGDWETREPWVLETNTQITSPQTKNFPPTKEQTHGSRPLTLPTTEPHV